MTVPTAAFRVLHYFAVLRLIRDRNLVYGQWLRWRVKGMGIGEAITAVKS